MVSVGKKLFSSDSLNKKWIKKYADMGRQMYSDSC